MPTVARLFGVHTDAVVFDGQKNLLHHLLQRAVLWQREMEEASRGRR